MLRILVSIATFTMFGRAFEAYTMPDEAFQVLDDFLVLKKPVANNDTAVPEAGGFTGSLKVSSLNHAMEYALKLGVS